MIAATEHSAPSAAPGNDQALSRTARRAWSWFGRLNSVTTVVVSKVVVLTCLWGGLLAYLDYDKRDAYQNAERSTASMARALEEHTLSTIRGIDQTAMFVKRQFEQGGGKIDLQAYGRDGVFLSQYFNLIGVINADGWFTMADRPLPASNLSDREHFKVHAAADSGQLFISKPVLGRSSGKWSIQFTRRINTPAGGFGGVVVLSLDPGYFNSFYRSIDVGDRGIVSLVGTDGIVRARTIGNTTDVGQDLRNTALYQEMNVRPAGSYFAPSSIDGINRLISFRRMSQYPLVVAVGVTEDKVLKEYREHRNVLLGLGAFITVLILAAGAALAMHVRYHTRVEATLRMSEAEARSASRLKSEFLANMSHELRTPMHAILSFAELGLNRRGGAGDMEKISGYLARIQQSGKRLLSLLNDLLDLSKLEAGRMQFAPALHPVRPVINGVLTEMSALLEKRGLAVRVAGQDAEGQAWFDLSKIAQVLHNLLGNASKFAPAGSVIEVTCDVREPGVMTVSVRDHGPGIPAGELELVFEQFIQSSKTKNGAGGTGLGLAICRQIVHAHGGRIWAANNGEAGCTFSFSLPLASPDDVGGHAAAEARS